MKKLSLILIISLVTSMLTFNIAALKNRTEKLLFDDFQSDENIWNVIDADGDGNYFDRYTFTSGEKSGKCLRSVSKDMSVENYAQSPECKLPDDGSGLYLTYYEMETGGKNSPEAYNVYIYYGSKKLNSKNIVGLLADTSVSKKYEFATSDTEFTFRHIDLGEFAGKNIRIVFHHCTKNGKGALLLDDIAVQRTPKLQFTDISKGKWYYESVDFVWYYQLFEGTSKTEFSPDKDVTRGMFVTVLWRMSDCPECKGASFDDVSQSKYYAEAVKWASDNGIVKGTGNNRFSPENKISREQMAQIIYKYAAFCKKDTKTYSKSGFFDSDKISSWAIESVNWCNSSGIINGTEKGTFEPKQNATRAEVAAIMYRYFQKFC